MNGFSGREPIPGLKSFSFGFTTASEICEDLELPAPYPPLVSASTPLTFGFDAADPIGRVTAFVELHDVLRVYAVLFPTAVSSWKRAVRRRRRVAERSRRNTSRRRPHGRTTTPARRAR